MTQYLVEIPSPITPHLSHADYQRMYAESLANPEAFWADQAKRLEWFAPFHTVKNTDFNDNVCIKWFEGGKLNVSHNCLDRHLATRGDQVAIIWEGDDPADSRKITYKELHADVCRFANLLKSRGVKKGDCVTIYLPMIPEAAVAMLACTRIGAVHSVVFGGFSPEALKGRIEDCGSKLVITTQEGRRGGKKVPLLTNVQEAVRTLSQVEVLVVKEAPLAQHAADFPAEPMDSEDPLFILYTSGSTGKPKGILHTTAGYLLYAATSFHYVFDYHEGEVFWCTADVGWVTGHSYVLYGPLACGATTLMFEGVPNYPDYSRFWQVVDKHQVNIFYTAPTAIRTLMKQGDEWVRSSSRKSLRLLGSVGEPINPEAWLWYYDVVGDKRCPIVDTWWQTETGGHLITPLVGTGSYKPGSAMQPFFGIKPILIGADGKEHPSEGALCIADSWPGQARSVWGDHARFEQTYFSVCASRAGESSPDPTATAASPCSVKSQKLYFSGDGAQRDADGHYWITGRMDDVLNVSGHRIGTAEVESALVGHNGVAEAAVVGFPHDIKGQGIYAYVILREGMQENAQLSAALKAQVVKEIGAIARPDVITVTRDLPKTRSGKIMRRILRKIAEGIPDFGDVSTLLNPEIVEELWQKHLAQASANP